MCWVSCLNPTYLLPPYGLRLTSSNYGYSEERKAEILRAYHERSCLRGLEFKIREKLKHLEELDRLARNNG